MKTHKLDVLIILTALVAAVALAVLTEVPKLPQPAKACWTEHNATQPDGAETICGNVNTAPADAYHFRDMP